MKTIELLNIEEQLRLIGGEKASESLIDSLETSESLIDSLEQKKVESVKLSYNFEELSKLTK